ncbi:tRNA-N6-isopentenyladenosine-37 thiotransferase enzyme MiaB [Legionella oakridgensis ATCC 33761 = DSM 21215]|uniref:tRNA-2-methylthio-N(6)-dimethylallyladenosine synthase n=3 Tax=Legionella oakridgensis TaxID=29423 RepID=W0BAC7_9GAMM|nr:tRNA-N6-isopentenyladenosine-37 thiotransferase enzyme MiaB [Legionella oakridgensis ATCC 33761 = DSM 21215]ETO92925.1 tRNA-i(6)A37 thiotransferase enzyme MiaB [Legionella oakridgensis RV-2-2007]KTD38624.1 (dimethylallyl)adenosine tRNA methylthiotransferase [Legionella oakridgensis]STY20541.1 isopentenyl-adenosine A37 tRNA methylthiolase [Legionella longbeachae]
MNEYDSSKMAEILLQSHGLEKTEQVEEADVILLNTCSIREKAQEKVFSQLGQWREYKRNNPHVVIGVGGCVASQEGADIIKRAPFVDLVFGPQTLHRLPSMLEERMNTRKPVVDISFPEIEKFDHLPAPRAEGPVAFVSIMEGCSKYCSYCVVPYTRGEEISRPFDDVLAECYQLAAQGVREINLLGQNVNDYRGAMHHGEVADLALLIHYLAAIDGIDRIRFTTSHPVAFSDNLIQAFAEVPELANHLHLPVQSGSDRILALMKRGYTAMEYKSKIRKLRKVRPDIRLSTDIIVGFPGETDRDFQDTMDLVHELGFDTSFSFIYSARPGTPAANLPDETPVAIKKQRLKILQDRLLLQASRYSQSMIGSTQRILITGTSKKNIQQLAGRTECNRVVNFDGPVELIGQFADVLITEAQPNSLRGRLVAEQPVAVA